MSKTLVKKKKKTLTIRGMALVTLEANGREVFGKEQATSFHLIF